MPVPHGHCFALPWKCTAAACTQATKNGRHEIPCCFTSCVFKSCLTQRSQNLKRAEETEIRIELIWGLVFSFVNDTVDWDLGAMFAFFVPVALLCWTRDCCLSEPWFIMILLEHETPMPWLALLFYTVFNIDMVCSPIITHEMWRGRFGGQTSHPVIQLLRLCTKGMIGCFLSHRRIWQKAYPMDGCKKLALQELLAKNFQISTWVFNSSNILRRNIKLGLSISESC